MNSGRHIIRVPIATTLEQESILRNYSGSTRFVWNRLLDIREGMRRQGYYMNISRVMVRKPNTAQTQPSEGKEKKKEKAEYEVMTGMPGMYQYITQLKQKYTFLKETPVSILRGAANKLEDAYTLANSPTVKKERNKAIAQAKTPRELAKAKKLGYPNFRKPGTFPAVSGFYRCNGIQYTNGMLVMCGFRDGIRLVPSGIPQFTTTDVTRTLKDGSLKTETQLVAHDGRHSGIVSSIELVYDQSNTYNEPYIDAETKKRMIRQRGGWFVCINTEVEFADTASEKAIGIDVGCRTTAMTSEGKAYELPQRIKELEQRKQVLQVIQSHKEDVQKKAFLAANPGGHHVYRATGKHRKLVKRIAAIDCKIANIRKTFLHTVSKDIVNQYGRVAVEAVDVKNMTASAAGTVDEPGTNVAAKSGLNRSILRNGWGMLRSQLKYKLERTGGELLVVNPAYTSQDCPECGHRDAANRPNKGERFKCVKCGYENNADIVGAMNILKRSEDPVNLVVQA